MSYPIYHGIKLAQSSEIHNLNVQTLADTAIAAITGGVTGRLVYDSTNDQYVYFKSDGSTENVTPRSLHDALKSLVDTINGDSSVDGSFRKAISEVVGTTPESLDTLQEISTALNNDPDLYNTITTLITVNIDNAKNELRGAVSDSFDTLEEVEAKLNELDSNTTSGLANEITDRIAADAAIQAELDASQVGAGLLGGGAYDANTAANFIAAATSLKDADNKLDTALQTEKDRALAAESAMDTRLSSVESQAGGNIGDLSTLNTSAQDTLVNAINEVHTDVDTEKARAEGIEATLDSRLTQEVADRAAQDNIIEGAVGLNLDGTYAAHGSANYIGAATTMMGSTVKLDTELKRVDDALTAEIATRSTQDDVLENSIGLNSDGSYAADVNATYTATASSVLDATSRLDTQVKTNTDGLAAEVSRSVALDGNITDGAGLNADGSYKGSGSLITKIAAPADIHSAVEGLASMINTVMMPAIGIQTATGTSTGAVDSAAYNTMNYVINPSSIPNAIRQLDTQVKVNTDAIVTEAATREYAINAGRLAVGLNTDGTYSPVAGAHYIAAAATVKEATELLDTQIKANADNVSTALATQSTDSQVIQDELDATQVGAGLEDSGVYTPKGDANYIAAATSLKTADEALDAALKNEVDRSTNEDDLIKGRVDVIEGQNLDARIGDLSLLTTDDASSLKNAVNEVDKQQAAIAYAAGLVENPAVGGSTYGVDLSASNYVASSPNLNNAIVELDSQTKTLDDAHKAGWFTFKSGSPANTHSVAHNLNSEFVNVQLWVKNPDDGKYRMDIAEVVEHDNNTLEVVMNAARDIKVVVQKVYA